MSFRLFRRLAVSLLGLTLAAVPVAAQDFRGSIAGTAVDSSGGVLPGATVTITNADTGVSQTVLTDTNGAYQVPYLNPGSYTVAIELSGFKKALRTGNAV